MRKKSSLALSLAVCLSRSLSLSLSHTHTHTHAHTHTHKHTHTTLIKKKGEQDPLREGSEHLSEQPTQPRFDDLIRDMNKAIDELGGEVRSPPKAFFYFFIDELGGEVRSPPKAFTT